MGEAFLKEEAMDVLGTAPLSNSVALKISNFVFEDSDALQRDIDKLVDGTRKLVLDISSVKTFSSAIVGSLIAGTKQFRDRGGVIHLVVSQHQCVVLHRMQLADPRTLGFCYLTRDEAEEAFNFEPPRLAS